MNPIEHSSLTLEILRIIVSLASILITYYLVPYIKSKVGNENLKQMQEWANIIVLALQQKKENDIINNPEEKENINKEKYTKAIELIEVLCNRKNISLNRYEISMLVESAVKNMKLAEQLQNQQDNNQDNVQYIFDDSIGD